MTFALKVGKFTYFTYVCSAADFTYSCISVAIFFLKITIFYWNSHNNKKEKHGIFIENGKIHLFLLSCNATADIPAFLCSCSSSREAEMESKLRTEVFTVTCDEREVFALPVITWTMHTAVY